MIRAAFVKSRNILPELAQRSNIRAVAAAGIYILCYALLAWLSNARPLLTIGITPWEPQAGLTLAFLLLYGSLYLPATVIALFLTEMLVRNTPVSASLMFVAAVWVGVTYGALAAILRRWGFSEPIRTAADAARMAAIAAAGTLIVAIGYLGLFIVAGEVSAAAALGGIARCWVGHLNGVLTVTPLLIYAANSPERLRLLQHHRWEILGQFAAIALMLWIIFMLPAADQLRLFYLLFVPIIWIALRCNWPVAMLAALVIQIGLLVAAEAKIPTARFIDLQFFLLTLSLTALFLGAVVAERAEVLRRVAQREAEQRALLAMAPDAILNVAASGEIQVANAAALRLFGDQGGATKISHISALLPGLLLEPADGRAALQGHRIDRKQFPAEIAWARLDPSTNGSFLVTVRDVSDRRRAEEQLRERDAALARAMRFAVAGELASSLAHELNQPITALVSYVRAAGIFASRATDADDRLNTTLSKATHEALRASEVLRRLRDFYQGGAQKRESVQITSLCDSVVGAFQDRLCRANASLVVTVDESIPTLECDAMQLEIVLHNLLGNAVDAVVQMPRSKRHILLHASFADGIVTLRVEDSGPGIPLDVADRLFEPFVTSKPDGMGLGLAISRTFIHARGGELALTGGSEWGGAAFIIRIPIEFPHDVTLV